VNNFQYKGLEDTIMTGLLRSFSVAVAMGAMVLLFNSVSRADDATTQPTTAPATGSIKVVVTGSDGKPVSGARVRVTVARGRRQATASADGTATTQPAARPARAPAVAQGTTDDSGDVLLDNIPAGKYSVSARNDSDRGRGRATVEAGQTVEVDIQLGAGGGSGGGGGGAGGGGGGNATPGATGGGGGN
jgi:hypothetical protein